MLLASFTQMVPMPQMCTTAPVPTLESVERFPVPPAAPHSEPQKLPVFYDQEKQIS